MITHEQLEAIRDRAEKATKGPWVIDEESYVCNAGFWVTDTVILPGITSNVYEIEDADFIANAREDIPALLAEVGRLKAQLADATSICLWSARRLSSVYKPYVYDYIDELSGEKSERL